MVYKIYINFLFRVFRYKHCVKTDCSWYLNFVFIDTMIVYHVQIFLSKNDLFIVLAQIQ